MEMSPFCVTIEGANDTTHPKLGGIHADGRTRNTRKRSKR